MQEEFLTVKDIQNILKIGKNTTLKLIALPDFPKIKVGRQIRIPRTEFYEYMKSYNGLQINL